MAKKHALSKSEASALRQEMIAAENSKQELKETSMYLVYVLIQTLIMRYV